MVASESSSLITFFKANGKESSVMTWVNSEMRSICLPAFKDFKMNYITVIGVDIHDQVTLFMALL